MTESQKTDHWGALASDLGAAPAPEQPIETAAVEAAEVDTTEQTPPVAPPPPAFRPAAKAVHTPRRPARPAAWEQLAGDLGIVVPPPPPQPQPAARAQEPKPVAVEPTTTAPPPPAEESTVAALEAEFVSPAWEELEPSVTEPGSYEPQEALDEMDSEADDEAVEPSRGAVEANAEGNSAAGETPTTDDQGRRRRRRRGRGRGRGRDSAERRPDPTSADATSVEPVAEGLAAEFAGESEPGDESDFGRLADRSAQEEAGEAVRGERRGRRRRRGRGRVRDESRAEAPASDEAAMDDELLDFEPFDEDEATADTEGESEATSADISAGDIEGAEECDYDDEDEHDGHFDEEGDDDSVESPRVGFRNIPTWQQAISVMIEKNMEARARNPGGSRGPSDRGRRGRGRGRRPDRR